MSKYWSRIIRDLEPYVPGEQPRDKKYIKLNTNENPYPPSPRALGAIHDAADQDLRLYPDPTCDILKAAVADYYRVSKGNVFVGNGSDEVLALAFLTFFKQGDPLLFPDVTYSFYEVYCSLFEIRAVEVPLGEDFQVKPEDYLRPNGGIVFANPNALTGHGISTTQIRELLERNTDSVVIVDEAYIDFGGDSVIPLIDRFPNLLVVQTFSKSRSLAGLRVGFAVGQAALIEGLERAKNSFNSYPLDRLALAGAVEAVRDEPYFQETCRRVIRTRERVVERLKILGFSVVPSQANFLLAAHEKLSGKTLYETLREKGILVRYFNKARVVDHVRITIGTDEEMDRLLEEVEEIVTHQDTSRTKHFR